MRILIILLIILSSCSKKTESKFQKINFDLRYNYTDSLGKKVIPNKKYNYWAYFAYRENYMRAGNRKLDNKILKEDGDTLSKKILNFEKPTIGFFQRGHPGFRCNYAVIIENGKVKYITTEEQFRDFIGTIDNLEEAILLARTYGYQIDNNEKANQYRVIENGYELRLMKYNEFPESLESIELKIGKDGTIKTKSLGIYKTKNIY